MKAVRENLRLLYFALLTLWPVRHAARRMSNESYPYAASKVAETKEQLAAGWAVEQVVAAAAQPPIAAVASN